MPVVVKAKKNQSTGDVIKQFKRLTIIANVQDIAKNRQFHMKPALKKNIKNNELKRQRRRAKRLAAKAKSAK